MLKLLYLETIRNMHLKDISTIIVGYGMVFITGNTYLYEE